MKRTLSVLLALSLLLTMALGLSISTGNAAAAEKLPLRYYMPGTGDNTNPDIIAQVNQKLATDGLAIDFQPIYIPWDAWSDKMNMLLSTGEEFEMFQVMSDFIPFSTYQGRGALAPLTSLVDQYGPALKQKITSDLWNCSMIGGEIYTIPAPWRRADGDDHGQLTIRKDLLDKAGLTIDPATETIPQLLDTLEALQKAWGGTTTPYAFDHTPTRPPVAFQRTYDSWPFYTSLDGLFYVDQQGNAKAYFETPEFKQDCAIYAEMYQRGLESPDILSLPQDTVNQLKSNGDCLLGIDTFDMGYQPGLRNTIPDATVEMFYLNPEKPALMVAPLLNSNSVPSTCKHPEVAVEFLNWLYSDPANHDLLIYGDEGVDYNMVSGSDKLINTVYNDANLPLHRFDQWMIGLSQYSFYEEGTPQAVIDLDTTPILSIVKSPEVGFTFNSEPVKVEYAQVQSEYTASILPIKLGVISYDDNFAAADEKMKAAGIDAVIAEYQKQLTAYIAQNPGVPATTAAASGTTAAN